MGLHEKLPQKPDEYKLQVKLGARGLGVGRGEYVCERERQRDRKNAYRSTGVDNF